MTKKGIESCCGAEFEARRGSWKAMNEEHISEELDPVKNQIVEMSRCVLSIGFIRV